MSHKTVLDTFRFLQLFIALCSVRRAWWSVDDLMVASGYSRAAVYRNLARMEELHIGLESAYGVLPGKPPAQKGWRCDRILAVRVRS